MNKKKLLVLPIVAIVVAMFCVFVMGASPVTGVWKVYDKDNIDQSINFKADSLSDPGLDLGSIPSIKAAIEAKGLKTTDFKFKVGYDVHVDPLATTYDVGAHNNHTVYFKVDVAANEYALVVHKGASGYTFNIIPGAVSEVSINNIEFSPFYVYIGSKSTSPQTGDFAPAYIAMISVALVSCGAIFAIRAKKATK